MRHGQRRHCAGHDAIVGVALADVEGVEIGLLSLSEFKNRSPIASFRTTGRHHQHAVPIRSRGHRRAKPGHPGRLFEHENRGVLLQIVEPRPRTPRDHRDDRNETR